MASAVQILFFTVLFGVALAKPMSPEVPGKDLGYQRKKDSVMHMENLNNCFVLAKLS